MKPRKMEIKWATTCTCCLWNIAVGETAWGIKNEHTGKWSFSCMTCGPNTPAEPTEADALSALAKAGVIPDENDIPVAPTSFGSAMAVAAKVASLNKDKGVSDEVLDEAVNHMKAAALKAAVEELSKEPAEPEKPKKVLRGSLEDIRANAPWRFI